MHDSPRQVAGCWQEITPLRCLDDIPQRLIMSTPWKQVNASIIAFVPKVVLHSIHKILNHHHHERSPNIKRGSFALVK